MYKLSLCIYLNHVPFYLRQKSMSLKVWSILSRAKKILKSQNVGLFSENHTKSNFSYGNLSFLVQFSFNLVKSES